MGVFLSSLRLVLEKAFDRVPWGVYGGCSKSMRYWVHYYKLSSLYTNWERVWSAMLVMTRICFQRKWLLFVTDSGINLYEHNFWAQASGRGGSGPWCQDFNSAFFCRWCCPVGIIRWGSSALTGVVRGQVCSCGDENQSLQIWGPGSQSEKGGMSSVLPEGEDFKYIGVFITS